MKWFQLSKKVSSFSISKRIAARAIAFAAICIAGLTGGAIGYSLVSVQCSGSCQVGTGFGLLIGSLSGAIGMSIVAVLVLRAVGEWREISNK